jgi:hypothetical protein
MDPAGWPFWRAGWNRTEPNPNPTIVTVSSIALPGLKVSMSPTLIAAWNVSISVAPIQASLNRIIEV